MTYYFMRLQKDVGINRSWFYVGNLRSTYLLTCFYIVIVYSYLIDKNQHLVENLQWELDCRNSIKIFGTATESQQWKPHQNRTSHSEVSVRTKTDGQQSEPLCYGMGRQPAAPRDAISTAELDLQVLEYLLAFSPIFVYFVLV